MDADAFELGRLIYAESGNVDGDTMINVGSSVLNRAESGRTKEFGEGLAGVIHKPNSYYATTDGNKKYAMASSGKFANAEEENKFKMAMSMAYGLLTGKVERTKTQFFFTDKEVRDLKKSKKFDFSLVKNVGKDDTYNYYSY